MTMLEDRLRSLGDVLDLEPGADPTDGDPTDEGQIDTGLVDTGLVDAVLARLDEAPARPDRRRPADRPWLRVAAALLLAVALVAVAVPASRRTVADWFGLDGVRVERRPGAPAVSAPDPFDGDVTSGVDSPAAPPDADVSSGSTAPSIGTVVGVGGVDILVSEFVGSLDNPAIGKTIGDGTSVQQVEVDGEFGLWIDGAPHDVSFFDEDGDIVFERFAGNTLLWQDGEVVRRLEGFADVTDAVEYAEQWAP